VHQLLFHCPLCLAHGVESEAIVLIAEPRNLALHPEIKVFVGEFVVEKLVHLLCIGNLLLDIQVLVMGDLFGDQRGEYLTPNLHQLVHGEVVLQQPVVRAALIACGF
jgi:hypothetical protein